MITSYVGDESNSVLYTDKFVVNLTSDVKIKEM